MASFANLSREERIGLGIAAAAHVALVAALVWQVRGQPATLPVPERITVSLATEVAPTSTAPRPAPAAQAAVAPEPIPTVQVKDVPKPAIQALHQPAPKATPLPRPSAAPAPAKPIPPKLAPQKPAKPAAGSRLGEDFLAGVSAGDRTKAAGTPAAAFGPAEQASLSQAINRQLKPKWNAPQGADAELLVTVLAWDLNPDGSLAGQPRVVSQSGITDSNRPQAKLHAERAIRAVELAAPFNLPPQFYDKWKRISAWRFDRKL